MGTEYIPQRFSKALHEYGLSGLIDKLNAGEKQLIGKSFGGDELSDGQ